MNYLRNAQFINNFMFFPDANSSENIEIDLHFSTPYSEKSLTYTNPASKRKIYTILNNDTINVIQFDSLAENIVSKIRINPQNLFAGANLLQLLNYTDDTANTDIGIKFFTLKGFSKPFAQNSNAVFSTEKVGQNSIININGFFDSVVIVYDSVSKSIIEKKGIPNISLSANSKNNPNQKNTNFVTLKINDEIYFSEKSCFHI
jgi:hypothetical protein